MRIRRPVLAFLCLIAACSGAEAPTEPTNPGGGSGGGGGGGGGGGTVPVTIDQSRIVLSVNDTRGLTSTGAPLGTDVTWTTSDANVASVSTTGSVTGKGFGFATITGTRGSSSATVGVWVTTPITGALEPELQGCPTPAEVAFVQAAFQTLAFTGDPAPTAVTCPASGAAPALTEFAAARYKLLVALARIRFNRSFEWTDGRSFFEWFIDRHNGIRFRTDVPADFAEPGARIINMRATSYATRTASSAIDIMGTMAHETRHFALPHNCQQRAAASAAPVTSLDQTQSMMGAWFVHSRMYAAYADGTDAALLDAGTRENYRTQARHIVSDNICEGPPAAPRSGGAIAFRLIVGGVHETCGLSTAGAAYCWGKNNAGQLGDGSTSEQSRPVRAAGNLTFSTLVSGAGHRCGVATDGGTYCWGAFANTSLPTPTRLAGSLSFTSLATGRFTTYGITAAGALYAFSVLSVSPGAAPGGIAFQSLSSGSSFGHVCGLTAAGAAYCVGFNVHGGLGNGSTSSVPISTPVPVSGGLAFQKITVGEYHTCAITTAGVAYCWGKNNLGQLGDGSSTDRLTPVAVQSSKTFKAINAGGDHTCAIATDDTVYCWGENSVGQRGDGTSGAIVPPLTIGATWGVPGQVQAQISNLGLGYDQTCGWAADGSALCWGVNQYGELGDGTQTSRRTPVAVNPP